EVRLALRRDEREPRSMPVEREAGPRLAVAADAASDVTEVEAAGREVDPERGGGARDREHVVGPARRERAAERRRIDAGEGALLRQPWEHRRARDRAGRDPCAEHARERRLELD